MENLTHSLTGYFLSRAGLNRLTPQSTAILVVAANIPDLDIAMLAGGGLTYFHYHRHLTHALIMIPVMAALAVAVVRIVGRRPLPLGPAFLAALIGVASHLLLDFSNEYGIRLLLPFSGTWLHADVTGVIDIWILTIFALCLGAPLLSKLVSGEIGGQTKQKFPSRGFAWTALVLVLLYDGGRWIMHERATAILNSRIYDGSAPLRVAAFPSGSNPFRWRGLVETSRAYQLFNLPVTGTPDPMETQAVFKADESPVIDAANRTEAFRVMRDFATYPIWKTVPVDSPAGGTRITLTDLRFRFAATAIADSSGKILSSVFSF